MSTQRCLTLRTGLGATVTLSVAIGLVAPALSQEPPREPALARSASDADLKWGACPAFFPAGCHCLTKARRECAA